MKIDDIKIISSLKTKTKVLIGICTPMFMLVALGAVSVFAIISIVDANKWVDHTNRVLGNAAAIVGTAVDMETGMRGNLLAGKEGFLAPYKNGEKATYAGIAALRQTVNDNPRQVERLDKAGKILKEWQAKVTEPTIALRREIGDAQTMNDMARVVGEARGKKYFDKFRSQIKTFIGREEGLLKERRAEFKTAEKLVEKNFKVVGDTTGWVNHTHEVVASAARLLGSAVDMETGMRGFLLAGGEEFLNPYNAGKKQFFAEMAALQKTVSDNPAQVKRLRETEEIIQNWIAKVTEPAIALRRQVTAGTGKLNDIQTLVARKEGKKFFDAFRAKIAAFTQIEMNLMAKRQKTSAEATKEVNTGLGVTDLSGTNVVVRSNFGTFGAGLLFRNSTTNALSTVSIGSVLDNFDGLSRDDRVRYDTPSFAGFQLSGSFLQGDASDLALRYSGNFGGTKFAAAAVANRSDTSSTIERQWNGSGSVLFANGFNLTVAGGARDVKSSSANNPDFYYVKVGYQAPLFGVGKTAFSAEYAAQDDLAADGDEASFFGIGVTQKLDDWGTELYAGFRLYQLDRTGTSFDDIPAAMMGAMVTF